MKRDPEVKAAQEYAEREFDGGRASEAVEQALLQTERFVHAARARRACEHAEDCQRDKTRVDGLARFDDEAFSRLSSAWGDLDDAVRVIADDIAADAVDATMHGHDVDLRHATRLPCPVCNDREYVSAEDGEPTSITPEAFYLGTSPKATPSDVATAVGWVCGRCGSTLEEWCGASGTREEICVLERGEFAPEIGGDD